MTNLSESVTLTAVQRVTACNESPVNGSGEFVLYWMTAYRRRHFNFALERAVFWAAELRKPLLVFEAVASTYRWASSRFHTFLIDGIRENLKNFEGSPAAYHPYIEPSPGEGRAVLSALIDRACIVVTDDFPAFEIPSWIELAASRSPVLIEKVDSNGLLPMRSTERLFLTAASFRVFVRSREPHDFPKKDPLEHVELPSLKNPPAIPDDWSRLPPNLDSKVGTVMGTHGGVSAARARLRDFLAGEKENSGLSPYLHFGHISSHEVYEAVAKSRHTHRERFLDQLTTWRELGFNRCALSRDYDRYESLPEWARRTLAKHAADVRPVLYSLEQLEAASTHDEVWNSAQKELVDRGRIGSYLRMLWGKKILEWTASPEEALSAMIYLNNKYALDGRDPNSYCGIFWTLGRYDRPWGPERPIFGVVRYMSSRNTAIKLRRKP